MRWLGPAFREAVASETTGIALTGAGSWLGQAFLSLLADEGVLSPPARVRLFGSSQRTVALAGRGYAVERLQGAEPLSQGRWLLLHLAFLGKERTPDFSAANFVRANDAILSETLRIAAPAISLSVIFASSGAVYGQDRRLVEAASSGPYGYCKVDHERRLANWCAGRDATLVVPRIFNIGGPSINKVDNYALSSFILSALREHRIRINAQRPTYRSYVHVNEVLGLACDAVLPQCAGAPLVFDTAGDEVVEMADLADAVARGLSPATIEIARAAILDMTPDRYVGDGATYRALLARHGRTLAPLSRIVADTIADLRQPETR